jgi:hypothetical protein
MILTLCEKDYQGDIFSIEDDRKDFLIKMTIDWLASRNPNESVFVSFASVKGLQNSQLRNEHFTILVSHSLGDIEVFVKERIKRSIRSGFDFSIFEFETYEDVWSVKAGR